MKRFLIWCLAMGMVALPAMGGDGPGDTTTAKGKSADGGAATTTSTTTTAAKPGDAAKAETAGKQPVGSASVDAELQQMKALLEAQAAQLAAQEKELESLRTQMSSAHAAAPAAAPAAGAAVSPATNTVAGSATADSSGTLDAATSGTGAAPADVAAAQGYGTDNPANKSPLSFKIGNAEFTPGGFMDFTTFYRSTNVGSGIGTAFGSIPYNNTVPGGGLSETRFSAQNSRIALRVDSTVAGAKVVGYTEADFLGNAPTNLFVTSNSNTLRMRLYFVDARWSKWEILGGQDWSMLTPNRKGIGFMPADIFYSQDMDTNYQVGLIWARQAQFRLIYHPTDNWAMGLSVENPEQYTGGGVTFPTLFNTTQVNTGANTSTPNSIPDVILKVAHDSNLNGKNWHVEAAGLLTATRLYTPATVTAANAITNSKEGGAVSVNLNLELFKGFNLITNTFWGDGAGRYIFGLGPNFIVTQNGATTAPFVPSLIHAGSGIGGFEWTVHKSLLYGYYGGAYYGRGETIDPKTGTLVGYGYDGSANSNNRAIQEGTIGLIQTFWKSPNYGALQLITQASYLSRAPWFVATGAPKNAHLVMGYVDLRYVLP